MKIYLAGPDVFRNNAIEHLDGLKQLCKNHGFTGLAPLDNVLEIEDKDKFTPKHSNLIFKANVDLIRECDVIIANILPFRGVCIDDGTAWEIGCGYALGKKIYGYSPLFTKTLVEITKKAPYNLVDKDYPIIEDFGNGVNLMICDSISNSGGGIFETFEDCLEHLSKTIKKMDQISDDVIRKEAELMEKLYDEYGEDSPEEDTVKLK